MTTGNTKRASRRKSAKLFEAQAAALSPLPVNTICVGKGEDTDEEDEGNDFVLQGSDQVEAYVEVKGGTGWLTFLDSARISFFSSRDKDRIRDESQTIRIPLMTFKTLQEEGNSLFNAVESNTDNPKLAEAVELWDSSIYLQYVKTCVEENREFSFAMLPAVLEYISNKQFAETGKALLLLGSSGVVGRYKKYRYVNSLFSGNSLDISVLNYVWMKNCVRSRAVTIRVSEWEGDKSLGSIGLVIDPDEEMLKDHTSYGKKALKLSREPSLVDNTSGYIEVPSWTGWRKLPALGRMMVDQFGMFQIDPETQESVSSTYGNNNVLLDSNEELVGGVDVSQWSAIDYAMLSPYVFGFSFKSKNWGRAHVKQVEDVSFRKDAFSRLVMEEKDKKLIHSLVSNFDVDVSADFVDGKGGGCVFLFHGEPGLGKTLTAEAVAEEVERPLYTVSVGELGVDVGALEANLKDILDMAARWNAVLLLDEADIFLEKRSSGDIERNAMVGTFLRLLEYYNGILVLTSNRVSEIDPAFYSRISFARKYKKQSPDTRKEILRGLLALMEHSLSEEDIEDITRVISNGRQLKNSLRLASMLAKGEGRELRKDDILDFLHRINEFKKSLRADL